MKKQTGGFAFPMSATTMNYQKGDEVKHHEELGMTMRDWFATHAPEMTEQYYQDFHKENKDKHWIEARSEWNYFYADAMIAERSK